MEGKFPMIGVIFQTPVASGASRLRVLDHLLVVLQIQWLRRLGVSAVLVEVGLDSGSVDTARRLREDDAHGLGVTFVPSKEPLGARGIARRAGLDDSHALFALPCDLLPCEGDGDADLYLDPTVQAPRELAPGDAMGIESPRLGPKDLLPVRSVSDAAKASLRLLETAAASRVTGYELRATEVEPGVWVGAGTRIEEGARLRAPAFIGREAVVRRGATVGPFVVLESRAVVEQHVGLRECVVERGTLVGRGVQLEHAVVRAHGVLDLDGDTTELVDDPLVLARRESDSVTPLPVRLLALAFLALLLPFASLAWARGQLARPVGGRRESPIFERAHGLAEVVRGRRTLLGVGHRPLSTHGLKPSLVELAARAPRGAFDIEAELVPRRATPDMRLRARAYYASAKCPRLDLELFGRKCLRSLLSPFTGRTSARRQLS